MKQLSYFDGIEIKNILEDGKNVILLEIDKELKMAFVCYYDGRIDMIHSSFLEIKTLPLGTNFNKELRSVTNETY